MSKAANKVHNRRPLPPPLRGRAGVGGETVTRSQLSKTDGLSESRCLARGYPRPPTPALPRKGGGSSHQMRRFVFPKIKSETNPFSRFGFRICFGFRHSS